MFPGSGSCLVAARWVSNGWEREPSGKESCLQASRASLVSPRWLRQALFISGPAVICYQAEPEEIDGDGANLSGPEGSPFANISSKEAGLALSWSRWFSLPSGQPCIKPLPGSEGCIFHWYILFRTFTERILPGIRLSCQSWPETQLENVGSVVNNKSGHHHTAPCSSSWRRLGMLGDTVCPLGTYG